MIRLARRIFKFFANFASRIVHHIGTGCKKNRPIRSASGNEAAREPPGRLLRLRPGGSRCDPHASTRTTDPEHPVPGSAHRSGSNQRKRRGCQCLIGSICAGGRADERFRRAGTDRTIGKLAGLRPGLLRIKKDEGSRKRSPSSFLSSIRAACGQTRQLRISASCGLSRIVPACGRSSSPA